MSEYVYTCLYDMTILQGVSISIDLTILIILNFKAV